MGEWISMLIAALVVVYNVAFVGLALPATNRQRS
jgi:hypothetical protein